MPDLTLDTLRANLHQALRAYHNLDTTPENNLADLLLVHQARQAIPSETGAVRERRAANEVILHALDRLAERAPAEASLLRRRFLDRDTSRAIALDLHVTQDVVYHRQTLALDQLAELLLGLESAYREEQIRALDARLLPATYRRLFGVGALQDQVEGLLLRDGEPWLVALVGIGGIGKTARADQLMRGIIRRFRFADVAAVRVEPLGLGGDAAGPGGALAQVIDGLFAILPDMPATAAPAARRAAVRDRLKTTPTLVLIDNLEDESDAAELYEHLGDWAEPSKFLLTSRARPTTARGAHTQPLGELAVPDALNLLRHEAATRGLDALADASEEQLRPIYDATGGNPLALKLVVGLAEVLPLAAILDDLQAARTETIDGLYRLIYWRAWRALSEPARALLEAMPLAGGAGVEPEALLAITGLDEPVFWTAVQELANRSLLETQGTPWQQRYGIHRLTETFLRADIIHWPDDA